MGQQVKHIFHFLAKDVTSLKAGKRFLDIDYRLLTAGELDQVRFVLGKLILDTLVYGPTAERRLTKAKKDSIEAKNSMVKGENKSWTSPSDNKRSPESASKTNLFQDNSSVTDSSLSRKLYSYSSHPHPDNISNDEHVKDKYLLSSLF
ncbi:hypothetical protein PHJA_002725500 [Phtheirospermum japonicum]|uniref:Uncharacterized protein n=1 Tax=Phtheirospermum japonicum TaxID=374723 RepID=A0A830DCP4_9LAMI|nr:hypothetical protein PHJA_002725500 [Phtheirospermum japonicum]